MKGLRRFLCLIVVLFIGFVLIRMVSFDTSIIPVITYEAPEQSWIEDYNLSDEYSNWTVAVNGNTVLTSDNTPIQPTASTAKMILALAIMEKKPFSLGEKGEMIEISQDFYDRYIWYINNNGSTTAVVLGEEISEYDALTAILLASSNNMADSLAIWAFSSLEEYRIYAQDMLERIGAMNTVIGVDASGYDKSTTSNAKDLALIGAKILENPVLAEIVKTESAEIPIVGTINNTNQLLGRFNIVGIKTGYIGESSGYCLVSGYRIGESIVTIALLGAPTREKSFTDSELLVQHIQSQLEPQFIVSKDEKIGYYDVWWAGKKSITTIAEQKDVVYEQLKTELKMSDSSGSLVIVSDHSNYEIPVVSEDFPLGPTMMQRFLHVFGWSANKSEEF